MKRKIISFVLSLILILSILGLNGISADAAGGSWKKDSTGWWYQYDGGGYAVGWTYIDGAWYYFTANGYMDYSEYRDGSWNPAYYGGHWASDSTGWWYTDYSGWYPRSEWLWIDGSCYYFKADGYMAANETIDGYYVGSNGARTSGYTHNWVTKTTYTTETQTVHHGATWSCNCCGATFNSEAEAQAHMSNSVACYTAGYDYCGAWDETVEVQVPHTTTICSECGATK